MTLAPETENAVRPGELRLADILTSAGLDAADVVAVRHTYNADGLRGPEDLTPEALLAYTRRQGLNNKLGQRPPRLWLVFIAEQGLRSRLVCCYENQGELASERTLEHRIFDLRPSHVLEALEDRLVISWSKDPVNWAKRGQVARKFPVLEIADRDAVPFPGFDRLILSHAELRAVVADSRYAEWRTALAAVQGIYLIADTSTGKLYVGKADGSERIWGRWSRYARDGHGGNVALRELVGVDAAQPERYQYSLLRVFGPQTATHEVDEAESYFKRALLTRQHGLNRN